MEHGAVMPTKRPPGARPWFPAQDAGEQAGAPARSSPSEGQTLRPCWLSPSNGSWGSGTRSADRAAPETRCSAPSHSSAQLSSVEAGQAVPGDWRSRSRGRPKNLALPLRCVQQGSLSLSTAGRLLVPGQAGGRRRLGTRVHEPPGAGAPQPHGMVPGLPSAGGPTAPAHIRGPAVPWEADGEMPALVGEASEDGTLQPGAHRCPADPSPTPTWTLQPQKRLPDPTISWSRD